jgi:hypothetical protein
MDRVSKSLMQKVNLSAYKGIIEKYLPAVLIKCIKFTNSKHLAETIVIYTFAGAYRLATQLDGANRMSVVIESMLNIVGGDFADGPNKHVNGQLLFENKGALCAAKKLAEMDMEDCLSRIDCIADGLDGGLLNRITETVMEYLEKQYSP